MKMGKNSRISGVVVGFPACEKRRKEDLINGNGGYASMLSSSWSNVFNKIIWEGLIYEV
jgi:hypothetical protein